MNLIQILRHVQGYRSDGPSWFERRLVLLIVLSTVGAVIALVNP